MTNIRVKVPSREFNAVRSKIVTHTDKVAEEIIYPQVRQIAKESVAIGRQVIDEAETSTGRRRVERNGGVAGRVDTGEMRRNFTYRVRKRANGISVFVGWVYGKPGYSLFQEYGTKRGVQGMGALRTANDNAKEKIDALTHGQFKATPVNVDGD